MPSAAQTVPLDSFFSSSGATGNETKNADLPAWLRAIGMKGDAYAGGMLKPEIRYGFAFKKGKIYFADGSSFAAKKNKDGTYAFTDANGQATSYNPTDEQNAYNKKYKASINNQSFLDKATNAVKFELDHGKQIISHIKPSQVFFGIDPLGTKIGNAVTGSHAQAQVDQLGGALPGRYDDYTARTGNETGLAKPLQGVAHTIAAAYGAKGLGRVVGNLAGRVGAANSGGAAGSDLGVFSNGGRAGLQGVGGGNAGALASSGAIAGGSGISGTSAGAMGGGMGTATQSGSGGWVDTLIDLGTDLAGAYLAGDAAHDASRTQAQGAAAAIAEQRRQYDLNREDLKPYREAGSTAIGQLSAGTADGGDFNRDFTLADFQKDPGYQFRMDEGRNAVEGSRAATTGIQNGRTLAELTRYGQDYGSGEYSNAYNRFNADRTTRFNRLATVAGVGQTATNTGVTSGSNSANNIADLTLERANANAAGRIGQANAYGQGLESLANFYRTRKYGSPNTNWIGG
jgi:hypothetical protein